jgi:alcohol dehydrogenase class IV
MNFNYFQPTELVFGRGRVKELGSIAKRFGQRTLLVTVKESPALSDQFARILKILTEEGLKVTHYDGVVPNPTVESIAAGSKIARECGTQSVIGLGGGSSMDSAKAIAVEATHEGSCWDYLFYKKPPTEKTLPIIAVSTTSGTGSQVTQVAVVTNPATRDKSAIYHPNVYPRVSIVDPELMVTLPREATAPTGFDALCHSFESTIHPSCSPIIELMAWRGIGSVVQALPNALANGADLDAREALALADTLGGYSIANAGVTLPHGIGMAIGGLYPHVAHGVALAIVYPAFARFTWRSAVPQFARLARAFDPALTDKPDMIAAERSSELVDTFLRKVGLRLGLADMGVPEAELPKLAKQSMVLPDYKANPRIATLAEMEALVRESYPSCKSQ